MLSTLHFIWQWRKKKENGNIGLYVTLYIHLFGCGMIIIYTACGCNAIGQQTTHLQVVLGDNVTHAPNKISVPVTMATEVLHQQGKFYANKGKSQQDVVVCI